jgi:hypothetical protein
MLGQQRAPLFRSSAVRRRYLRNMRRSRSGSHQPRHLRHIGRGGYRGGYRRRRRWCGFGECGRGTDEAADCGCRSESCAEASLTRALVVQSNSRPVGAILTECHTVAFAVGGSVQSPVDRLPCVPSDDSAVVTNIADPRRTGQNPPEMTMTSVNRRQLLEPKPLQGINQQTHASALGGVVATYPIALSHNMIRVILSTGSGIE